MKNCEIEEILTGGDTVKIVKAQRICWYGHIFRRGALIKEGQLEGKQNEGNAK